MDNSVRYRITAISPAGKPISPPDVKNKFVKACGVVVRDHIPITVREWLKPKAKGISYVGDTAKENLFKKVMTHFTLPALEVDPDEEEPNEEEMKRRKEAIEKKVKAWALKKMADLFRAWKKRLNLEFIEKDKTPDFDNGYDKIRDYWEDFVAYKKSDPEALKRSETNKKNASQKKFHHTMGSKGYDGNMAKWDALETELDNKGFPPEPRTWNERTRNWFYGHGGTLDPKGKAIFNQRHKDNPLLPIEEIRKAVKDVEEGRFVPDRENDELSRALGNKEHDGRARGFAGSPPWTIAFPEERKKFSDRSHQRRKEREEAEKAAAAAEKAAAEDRLRVVEAAVELLEKERLERLGQQGSGQSQRLMIEGASNRKSSVASTQLQEGDDDAPMTTDPPRRYPVDDITETTHCELKVELLNLKLTVAEGMAIPIGRNPTYHSVPVPQGYAVVTVDEVRKDYEELKLDYPAGEDRDLTDLGDAKKMTVLWPKKHIFLPYWTPRPPTPQSSNPSSPPPHQSPAQPSSLSPHQSPAQPSPPPRQPSPSTEAHSQKRKRGTKGRFRSPKRKSSPLPEIPHKNMQKRPWDYSAEENKERADAHYQQWLADMANKKKPKEPEFPVTPEEHAACVKMVKTLAQPPPTFAADYERSIRKSAEAKEQRLKSSKSSGKSVAQLGLQKNQSCPPLKVYSDTEVCSSRGMMIRKQLISIRSLLQCTEKRPRLRACLLLSTYSIYRISLT